jgi:hypothetical protein
MTEDVKSNQENDKRRQIEPKNHRRRQIEPKTSKTKEIPRPTFSRVNYFRQFKKKNSFLIETFPLSKLMNRIICKS